MVTEYYLCLMCWLKSRLLLRFSKCNAFVGLCSSDIEQFSMFGHGRSTVVGFHGCWFSAYKLVNKSGEIPIANNQSSSFHCSLPYPKNFSNYETGVYMQWHLMKFRRKLQSIIALSYKIDSRYVPQNLPLSTSVYLEGAVYVLV